MKGTIREEKEIEWGKIREEDKSWETINSGKQRVAEEEVGGGMGVNGWGELRRALWWDENFILYVGKLNLNKIF